MRYKPVVANKAAEAWKRVHNEHVIFTKANNEFVKMYNNYNAASYGLGNLTKKEENELYKAKDKVAKAQIRFNEALQEADKAQTEEEEKKKELIEIDKKIGEEPHNKKIAKPAAAPPPPAAAAEEAGAAEEAAVAVWNSFLNKEIKKPQMK
jgi:hypothetical protein